MAVSVVSVAYNVAAAALLAPLAATTAFILAIETVTDRRFYVALDLALAVLPDDPDRGAPILVGLAVGSLGLLAFACARVAWLFPSLLLVGGGAANAYCLAANVTRDAEPWIMVLGVAGMALSALQVRRATRLG